MSQFNNVSLNTDNPTGDAFRRLRGANPETIFDSKQIFDNQPLFWDDQEVSGSGTSSTHNANQASTTLSVSASTAGRRIRQTFQSFNYQPGKALAIIMTGVLGSGGSGLTSRIGYGDDKNGVFLESINGINYCNIRSFTTGAAVNDRFPQRVA